MELAVKKSRKSNKDKKGCGCGMWLLWVSLLMLVIFARYNYEPYMKTVVYPRHYMKTVEAAAKENGVESSLIYAIIKAESGFNEKAVSSRGAKGLMQIMDETGEWIFETRGQTGEFDIFDPETNINAGTWYIAKLLSDNDGDMVAALASYNAGGGNVSKWLEESGKSSLEIEHIPFEETEKYVEKTLKYYEQYKKLYG